MLVDALEYATAAATAVAQERRLVAYDSVAGSRMRGCYVEVIRDWTYLKEAFAFICDYSTHDIICHRRDARKPTINLAHLCSN